MHSPHEEEPIARRKSTGNRHNQDANNKDFFQSLIQIIPSIETPIQLAGLIILLASFLATRFIPPGYDKVAVTIGGIGGMLLVFIFIFKHLDKIPLRQRVPLIKFVVLLFFFMILGLSAMAGAFFIQAMGSQGPGPVQPPDQKLDRDSSLSSQLNTIPEQNNKPPSSREPDRPPTEDRTVLGITILHINDTHGRVLPYLEKSIDENTPLSGSAYLARMIETARSENPDGTLLLSAGDMFQGTPLSNVFKGQPVMEVMNYLKFDAMTLGNHEFDWGQDVLHALGSSAAFPFLSANIKNNKGEYLPGVKPYVILSRKGLKIAVIGLTTPETPVATKPSNVADLIVSDPVEAAPGLIEKVRSEHVNLVVVLSHLGLAADRELARRVRGIDVIVGGHSHTVVSDPLVENGTIIAQAGYYGLYLGNLELRIEPQTNKIIEYTRRNALKLVSASPEAPFDEEVSRIAARLNDQIKDEFSKEIGATSVDLLRRDFEESNIGNLIADSMRQAAGADIALQNGGGIRADLPKGTVTMEGAYSVLPFDNILVTMDLVGSRLLETLEKNAVMDRRILQISGISVEYDIRKPVGSRVVKAMIEGEPLDPERSYSVTVNDFMAAGGDGLDALKEGKNIRYGDNLRDVFIEYMQTNSPVSPKIENRIGFLK